MQFYIQLYNQLTSIRRLIAIWQSYAVGAPFSTNFKVRFSRRAQLKVARCQCRTLCRLMTQSLQRSIFPAEILHAGAARRYRIRRDLLWPAAFTITVLICLAGVKCHHC